MKSLFSVHMHNFGKNVVYQPRHLYTPKTEDDVLAILARHRDARIRVQGSGHSWSGIVEATDVLVSVAHFVSITVEEAPAGPLARVGAGATIEQILAALRQTPYSLPTLGAIVRQTIAGAIATATHGSGNGSLSSLVRAVKLACYDAGGKTVIKTLTGGDELLATRTSLGCVGVILEITLELVPRFWIHDVMKLHDSLESVLLEEAEWPEQQFLVFPYGWRWYAYHRKRVPGVDSRDLRRLRWLRAYDILVVELGLNTLVKGVQGLARLFGTRAITGFWKYVLPPMMRSTPVSGDSETVLTLHTRHHHIYRHVEMELFVPRDHLPAAAAFLEEAIPFLAGIRRDVSVSLSAELERVGLLAEYQALGGRYVHHYLIFCRRVLAEQTLLAMSEGGERYSISLFTFEPERRRAEYYAACEFLARAFARLYSARPHWGKYNPLTLAEIGPLYPRLGDFWRYVGPTIRMACSRTPTRRQSWVRRLLALRRSIRSLGWSLDRQVGRRGYGSMLWRDRCATYGRGGAKALSLLRQVSSAHRAQEEHAIARSSGRRLAAIRNVPRSEPRGEKL